MANVSWGVTSGVPSVRVSLTIEKTEKFFRNLGLKTRLDEAGIGDDTIEEIVRRFNESRRSIRRGR